MTNNQKTIIKLLNNIMVMCENNEDDAEMFLDELNMMLDELVSQDAFGTEGQCDPRGDQRDKY